MKDLLPIIEEQLQAGGSASFTVHGTSMQPLLFDRRDSVVIAKNPVYKKRDIILYRRDNGLFILHRIVGVKNGDFVCRGDNQTENEYPVKSGNIIGAVREYERNGVRRDMNEATQRVYSFLWVNTVFVRKLYRKIKSILRRK